MSYEKTNDKKERTNSGDELRVGMEATA